MRQAFLFPRIRRASSRPCWKVFCHPPVSVLKRCNVSLARYIDDRHVGQLFASPMRSVILPSTQRAEAAAYIVCYILIEAGYFINTDKSQYVPSTVVCFLCFFFYAILCARRFYSLG